MVSSRIVKVFYVKLPGIPKISSYRQIFRSTRSQMFYKVGFCKDFTKFIEKHLCCNGGYHILRFFDILLIFFFTTTETVCLVISKKKGLYDLPHELLTNLVWDLGKLGDFRKISKLHKIIA